MTVELKWVPTWEASDHRKKGWSEVLLHDGGCEEGHFLMASPVEEAAARVECPNCGQPTGESPDRPLFHDHLCQYPCEPAQPEPAASVEMPEAVSTALKSMRFTASNHRISDAETKGLLDNADALETFWRTHAQPRPKLEKVREALEFMSARMVGQHAGEVYSEALVIKALAELDAAEGR